MEILKLKITISEKSSGWTWLQNGNDRGVTEFEYQSTEIILSEEHVEKN